MPNTENELKLHLIEKHYLMLLKYFEKSAVSYEQNNIFFDSETEVLKNNLYALRLRAENEKYFITAKGPKTLHNEITVRDEVECEISPKEANDVLRSDSNFLSLNISPLKWLNSKIEEDIGKLTFIKIAGFKNLRHCIQWSRGGHDTVIELDKTDFGGANIEYELEVEFFGGDPVNEIKDDLRKLFAEMNIPWVLSEKSKFAKALYFKMQKKVE